jgi:secreted Zn-dependent insulinase-like peptidase
MRYIFFSLLCTVALWGCEHNAPERLGGAEATALDTTQPIVSPADDRAYRHLTLDNGLAVLVVSDPDTPKAAAAMDVMVGSGENPADRGGLAHFLEHMLFMGTEKYPDVDDYDRYIKENGGANNAYTSFEHTNYFFDIQAGALEGALDRFSQFFIAPLLNPDYVAREMNAVEAEYQMGIRSDGRRMLDVLREIVHPEHPFSRFAVGSLQSLADRPGQDITTDLRAFYERYYSAPAMRLVIYGRESLDELQALAEQYFADVPNRGNPVEAVKAPLFAEGTLPLQVNIEPAATQRSLELLFPVPDYRSAYRSKPLSYIGNLLGHEGEGSLLSYLKEQGLAEGLGAGTGLNWRGGGLFYVEVGLTEAGIERWQEIADATFHYIDLVSREGVESWRFAEESQLGDLGFRFQEEREPMDYVTSLATAMQYYDSQDILRGPYFMDRYDDDLIHEALDYLSPDNAMVLLSYPGIETQRTSEYFFVNYGREALPWATAYGRTELEDERPLVLPSSNPFIPQDFSLITPVDDFADRPMLIETTPRQSLWYRQDAVFASPKAIVQAKFAGGDIASTPKLAVSAQMYTSLVADRARELTYPALLAGLNYSLSSGADGLNLTLSGYNDKLGVLLGALVPEFTDMAFEQQRFDSLRAEMIKELANSVTDRPYSQTRQDFNEVMYSGLWSEQARADALRALTLSDVTAFAEQFWARASAQVMVYGNVPKTDALTWLTILDDLYGDAEPVQWEPQQVTRLDPASPKRLVAPLEHEDSVVFWYRQAPDNTLYDRAMTAITGFTSRQGFFNDLRTERQMGYVAASFSSPLRDVPGWAMMVQSPNYSAADVADAMAAFVAHHVESLDESSFERYKEALINELLKPTKNLYEQGAKDWRALLLGDKDFDDMERIADTLRDIDYATWVDYYRRHFVERPAWLQVVAPGQFGALPTQTADAL